MKRVLFCLSFILLLALFFGCSGESSKYEEGYIRYNGQWITRSEYSRIKAEEIENTNIQPSSQQSYTYVNATQLHSEYEANEVAADQKYKGRTLIIKGIINDIGKDIMGEPYVILGTGKEYEWGVQCLFKSESVVAQLIKGEQIGIQGKCDGFLLNVIVRDCILVSQY